jgi:Transketolase, C-terminal domain
VTAGAQPVAIAGDALQSELPAGKSANGLDLSGLGTIMVPSSMPVLEQMLNHALSHSGPCLLTLSEHDYAPAELPARPVFPGKADLLADGNALVLLAVGQAVAPALSAARELTVEGVSTAVIDVRFLRPLDGRTLLASLEPAQAIVLLDDPSTPSGFVDLLLEFYEAHRLTPPLLYMPAPIVRGRLDASDRQKTSTREIVEQCQQFLEVVHTRAESLPGSASNWEHVADLPGLDVGQAKDAVQRVLSRRLSDELSLWATVYEEVGNRGEYLWKWCREGVELTTLPCVAPSLLEHGGDTKVLSIILCVLLDDIADKHGNLAFLETLIDIVEHGRFQARSALGPDECRYAEVTCRLSEIYRRRLQDYPCFEAFEELLQYDLIQFSNTLRYSHLLNRQLSLLNMAEHDLYLPHNMHMMSFATIDLMCSPEFKVEDLGHLREAVWHGQCMGRIGNLLSTWRREIGQRDFTSGVFARAVAEGDLTIGDLRDGDPRDLEAAICRGRHEQYFFDRWHHHRQRLRASLAKVRSVQIQGLLEGHERFFQLHLASRGRI